MASITSTIAANVPYTATWPACYTATWPACQAAHRAQPIQGGGRVRCRGPALHLCREQLVVGLQAAAMAPWMSTVGVNEEGEGV